MFCPTCKIEYRPGFTHCADCDVDLVVALGPEAEFEDAEVLLFDQADAVLRSVLVNELEKHQIFFSERLRQRPRFVGSSPFPDKLELEPVYEIRVPREYLDKAKDVLSEVMALESELPLSEEPDISNSASPRDDSTIAVPAERPSEELTEELWAGEDKEFAQFLLATLIENGVSSHLALDKEVAARVFIASGDRERAREILREIIEATPPE